MQFIIIFYTKWKKSQAQGFTDFRMTVSKISTINSGDTVTVSHCRSVTVRTSLKSQRFETRTFSKPFIFRRDELFIYAEYLVNTDNAKTILTEVIQDNWHAGAVISQGRVTNLNP